MLTASTTVSKTVSGGSNPSGPAKYVKDEKFLEFVGNPMNYSKYRHLLDE